MSRRVVGSIVYVLLLLCVIAAELYVLIRFKIPWLAATRAERIEQVFESRVVVAHEIALNVLFLNLFMTTLRTIVVSDKSIYITSAIFLLGLIMRISSLSLFLTPEIEDTAEDYQVRIAYIFLVGDFLRIFLNLLAVFGITLYIVSPKSLGEKYISLVGGRI